MNNSITTKKILFINSFYYPYIVGGAEIIFKEQVETFKSRGYDVVVLSTGKAKGIVTENINGIKVYRAGIRNIYWHFNSHPNKYIRMLWHLKDRYNRGMQKEIEEVINKEKPDIAVCHNITGFSISIYDELKISGVPIVQVLHDLSFMCPGANMFKDGHACERQCRACRWMRRKHVRKSGILDAVVGVSAYVLNRLKANGYFKNVPSYVIHNAREIPEPAQRLIWTGNEPLRIGYIGTLSRVKGVEWLIVQFMKMDINAVLTIAGKGESEEYEKYLRTLATNDTRISFSGYVKSTEHYSNIHLSVVPSKWPDTFPTVAFESCAYHVPVIATQMGGLPEIIKEGINGWFCDVNNPDSLGETILKIYNSPEILETCSRQARNSVSEMLDTERMIKSYEDIVENIK
jgi:glycosyltransferase involved in cell wall biosynthesis